jgi:hypothetical protein
MKEKNVSTQTFLPSVSELALVSEIARDKYTHESAVRAGLDSEFAKRRLTASPKAYATMRAEVEQQELIVQAAMQARDIAEAKWAAALAEEEKRQAEEVRCSKRESVRNELNDLESRIAEMIALHRSIPDKLTAAQWQRSRLLQELATLG